MKKHSLELSVHQLVDFLLRKGDIDNRVFNRSSMNEGTLLHALYQSKQGKDYISEYPLKMTFAVDEVEITLQGRADGIIQKGDEYVLDEIKTTIIDLKEFRDNNLDWHLGQAKCYAYMFAKEKSLETIGIKLTYIKQGDIKEKLFCDYTFFTSELETYIYDLLEEYVQFYNIVFRLQENRNESIKTLDFPFTSYRKGQRDLAKYSYSIATRGGKLYIEAPTGIGKTMSTLYPFIKAMKDDEKSKIFYLTAKNSGKMNAHQAIKILKEKGLHAIDILVTAKERICFCKDKECNPDECPFAQGYYNKIQNVIKQGLLSFDEFDYETIVAMAKTYEVCPFELQLDLSLFSDIIICDYNYLFDPISYLKRFFDEDSSHYLALVDEAHNLVDRSRSMYSSSLMKSTFLAAKKSIRGTKNKKIKLLMSKTKKILFDPVEELENGIHEYEDLSIETYRFLDNFVNKYQEISKENNKDITKELTELYLEVNRYKRIADLFNDKYIYYVNKTDDDVVYNLTCLDASSFIKAILGRIKGSVLFSATLSPSEYYIDLLGGDNETNPSISLESPFPKENLKVLVAPKVSVKYKNREKSYQEVSDYIKLFISQKIGNYFVYLPSYEYLDRLKEYLDLGEGVETHFQEREMSELEKEDFLSSFQTNPKHTNIGFAIIGGAFGEGVDLVSDRLIGVVIVGIGLPKINYESDKIASYFETEGKRGYNYAYLYPGMNKVMQAVGRLIRTETDRGVALLIDERYLTNEYRSLFRKEWDNYEVIINKEEIHDILQKFLQ